jgi:hypothetical protein
MVLSDLTTLAMLLLLLLLLALSLALEVLRLGSGSGSPDQLMPCVERRCWAIAVVVLDLLESM